MSKTIALRATICAVALLFLGARPVQAIEEFKIENPDEGYLREELGTSVAIDGDTMVAGAPETSSAIASRHGVALVYKSDGAGGWTQEAELITDDADADDMFGSTVAISGDTIVVGTPVDDDDGPASGSAYVFTRTGSVWTQQQKLTASDAYEVDRFGDAVSISGDTIAVAADYDDDYGE